MLLKSATSPTFLHLLFLRWRRLKEDFIFKSQSKKVELKWCIDALWLSGSISSHLDKVGLATKHWWRWGRNKTGLGTKSARTGSGDENAAAHRLFYHQVSHGTRTLSGGTLRETGNFTKTTATSHNKRHTFLRLRRKIILQEVDDTFVQTLNNKGFKLPKC